MQSEFDTFGIVGTRIRFPRYPGKVRIGFVATERISITHRNDRCTDDPEQPEDSKSNKFTTKGEDKLVFDTIVDTYSAG